MALGFGVIGVGTWGRSHARVYSQHRDAKLIGVCDLDQVAAESAAREFGAETACTDFRRLLEHPDISAVSVATPDFAHAEPVLAALRAGKHVLVEKPLATTLEEARDIVAAAEAGPAKLMVDFHNRWSPPFFAARQAVQNGRIGEPLSACIRLNDTLFVPTKMLSWAARSSVLWFLGSHCVDVLRWMLGDEVASVYAVSRATVLRGRGIQTPDLYHTVLQFRRGASAVMENSWVLPETEPSLFEFRFDLCGSDGSIRIDASHNGLLQTCTRDGVSYPAVLPEVEVQGTWQGFALESIRAFVQCVVEESPSPVPAREGLRNTEVLLAIEQSARTGQPVTL